MIPIIADPLKVGLKMPNISSKWNIDSTASNNFVNWGCWSNNASHTFNSSLSLISFCGSGYILGSLPISIKLVMDGSIINYKFCEEFMCRCYNENSQDIYTISPHTSSSLIIKLETDLVQRYE